MRQMLPFLLLAPLLGAALGVLNNVATLPAGVFLVLFVAAIGAVVVPALLLDSRRRGVEKRSWASVRERERSAH